LREERTGPWLTAEVSERVKRGVELVSEKDGNSQATTVRKAVMAYLKKRLGDWR